ncbi:SDR family NAD(P)-dependent oxidoreductase [Desulfonatronospira sp.]|uniref:SDR family NAD(P)-dependent oxidoreductase n=1 Tax=Desulfonatronospira sp. TaxID=1962951 RepID=UPI0025BD95D0|nr:SDR family NAD(P)-dependent oxidoreductase [Desulfonatronospira sp.]
MLTKNSTFIITGASMGIGKAISLGLAKQGVNLVLNARSQELLEETAARCSSTGIQAIAVPGDISLADTVLHCLKAAQRIGNLSGFIHVAGLLFPGPTIWELDEDKFAKIFDVNVKASYLMIKYFVPKLISTGHGVAVFAGSGAAEITQPGIAAYCAAKAAQEHLVRQLAAENSIVISFIFRPGIVDTRMQEQAREAKGGAAKHLHQVFRPWKKNNQLLTPDQSASALIKILQGDIRGKHGQIVSA